MIYLIASDSTWLF